MEANMSRKTFGQSLSRPTAALCVVIFLSLCTVLASCGGDGNKRKNPVPLLTSVSPTTATAGGAAFTLTVNGLSFVAGSTVHWNGDARGTTFVGGTQLDAAILAADLASAGTAQVTVVNPTPRRSCRSWRR
jgi:IPT/TIG domain